MLKQYDIIRKPYYTNITIRELLEDYKDKVEYNDITRIFQECKKTFIRRQQVCDTENQYQFINKFYYMLKKHCENLEQILENEPNPTNFKH